MQNPEHNTTPTKQKQPLSNPTLDDRLTMARMGWPIGLTNPAGSDGDKHSHYNLMPGQSLIKGPGPKGQGGFWYATTDPAIITKWTEKAPDCHTFIACWPDYIVCLDIDNPAEFERLFPGLKKRLMGHGCPTDVRDTEVGQKCHIWVRLPQGVKAEDTMFDCAWGQIKRWNGLVVSSPTIGRYENAVPFCPVTEVRGISKQCLEQLQVPKEKPEGGKTKPSASVSAAVDFGGTAPEGSRNTHLTSTLGAHRAKGAGEAELLEEAHRINETEMAEPLPKREVEATARSVARYPTSGEEARSEFKQHLPNVGKERIPIRITGRIAGELYNELYTVCKALGMFNNEGRLVILDKHRDGGIDPQALNGDALAALLSDHVDWMKLSRRTGWAPDGDPPIKFLKGIVSRPKKMPRLDAIATCPYFTKDGVLVQEAGYNESDHTYLALEPGLQGLNVPKEPDDQDVAEALGYIFSELLVDFPFESDYDRANALAAFITPLVRNMVTSAVPAFLVDAPIAGTGKTLLMDLIQIVVEGSTKTAVLPTAKEEQRKVITTNILRKSMVIAFDNVNSGIWSGDLAAALTADNWSDRLLGGNRIADIPIRCLFIFTGNNIPMSYEIGRRVVRIRLNAQVDDPSLRVKFKHKDIKQWARLNRGSLVKALLTIAQAWVWGGKQPGEYVMGSFDSWATQIGGLLDGAGVAGFLSKQAEFRKAVSQDDKEWGDFGHRWLEEFGTDPQPCKLLFGLAERHQLLDHETKGGPSQFGKILSRKDGTPIIPSYSVLVHIYDSGQANRYSLAKQKEQK